MSLKSFLKKTQLLLEQSMYESRRAMSSSEDSLMRLPEVTQLEERILMSASPLAVLPDVVDTAADAAQGTPLNDQQLLDVIADDVLPASETAASAVNAADTSDIQQTVELVFIDADVSDAERLIADLEAEDGQDESRTLEYVVLDANRNGLAQITETLLNYDDIDGIHILSHGSDGRVQLGNMTLSMDNIDTYRSTFAAWQGTMSENADLLFYGCDLAATENGRELMNQIGAACDCDVAASEDLTGHESLGGDWDLEYHAGEIETDIAFSDSLLETWQYVLASPNDIATPTTEQGGITLNEDTGNDNYLIADDGAALLGGLTQFTYEMQFSASHPTTLNTLVSYAISSDSNELTLIIRDNGELSIYIGSEVRSSAIDYGTLEDGNQHSLALTWDSTAGDWEVFVDGTSVDSGTGHNTGNSIGTGGELVFGQEQDSLDGGYDVDQRFTGRLYDARFFNDIRTDTEIAANYNSTLPFDEAGMIANWTFNDLSTDGVVTESVSGNNLTVGHATGTGFVTGEPELRSSVYENSANGTVVGSIEGVDAERTAEIASLLLNDSNLRHNAESGKFYKVVSGSVDWASAKTAAEGTYLNSVAGQLVTIRSASENAAVTTLAGTVGGSVWLGGTDQTTEGDWRWIDSGSEADQFWSGAADGYNVGAAYQNWVSASQPNNLGGGEDAMRLDSSDGRWYDSPTTGDNQNYIVEWHADAVLDIPQALTYSILTQSVAGAFTVDGDSGQVTVADSTLLDFDTLSEHTVTYRVTDINSNTHDEAFIIRLTDLDDTDPTPTDLSNGIALNTDGGNDAYLVTTDAGNIVGGLSALTVEVSFSTTNSLLESPLISYASASDDNTISLDISPDGTVDGWISTINFNTGVDLSGLNDGEVHSIAFTWDNHAGDWKLVVDGDLRTAGTGLATGTTIEAGGTMTFGQEQDSIGGGFDTTEVFSGTLHDVRIWNSARSVTEIATNYQQKLDSTSLPTDLVANWQMTGFNGSSQVVDVVASRNLSVGHASGGSFSTSTPDATLTVNENAVNGRSVGFVRPTDADSHENIVADSRFLDSGDTVYTEYTTGETFGGWTVVSGDIGVEATWADTSPLGGVGIDMNGTGPGAISQTLTTEIGREYQVSFALAGNFNTGEFKEVRVSTDGHSHDYVIDEQTGWAPTDLQWEHRTFTFVAESTSTTLMFESLSGLDAAGAVISDVQAVAIPSEVSDILNADSTLSYNAVTGKFYRFIETNATWSTAQSNAVAAQLNGLSGQLITIKSEYENSLIFDFASESGHNVYLGAADQTTEGDWYWLDGTDDNQLFWVGDSSGSNQNGLYENWRTTAPNGGATDDVARMRYQDGEWTDRDGTSSSAYVIEWDAGEVLSKFTFTLTNDASGRFAINGSTGEITVADGSQLDYEANTSHAITARVTDAAGNTYDEVLTINVSNLGGEPAQTLPTAQSTNEDVVLTFSSGNSNAITVSDTGAANTPLQVSLSVTNGVLKLSQLTGISVVSGADDSAAMTIQGTESDLNAALEGMTFTPTLNYYGVTNLQVTTSLGADLSGHYTFDAGTAVDDSAGVAQDGSFFNDATTVTDGTRGEVLTLDGVGDAVRVTGRYSDPANVTLAAWVNLTSADTGGAEVISLGDNVILRVDDVTNSGLVGSFYDGTDWVDLIDTGTTLAGQGWNHVAYTVNDTGNSHSLYLNGELVAQATTTGSITYTQGANTTIGVHGNAASTYDFNGLIDDARIYARAVSADEIAAMAGDVTSVTGSVGITVNSANDAPSGTNKTISFDEDTTYTLTVSDFGYADSDGNDFDRVWIMTLPVDGDLLYEGSTFGAGNYITEEDIGLNKLTYQPDPDGSGTGYASFTFQVQDDGGTANGGANRDTTSNTIIFNVDALNDDPEITSNGGSGTAAFNLAENLTAVTTVTSTDVDGGTAVYSIIGGADAGLFSIDGSSGDLTFDTAPEFALPGDADADNVYEVTVQVSDGITGTDTQALSVTITNSSASTKLYLKANTTIPFSVLSTTAPVATSLINNDPANDSEPGLHISKGGSGANETENDSHHTWVYSGAVEFDNDPVQLSIWSDGKDGMNGAQTLDSVLGKSLTVNAYLLDMSTASTESGGTVIASASLTDSNWGDGYVWENKTIDFGSVTYTVASGRHLGVKLVVDDASGGDGWFAYDTTSYDSYLRIGAANATPVGLPTISGTVTEDQVLTADTSGIGDADGLGAFSYQWERDGSDISGADSSTYTLGDSDVGTQISVQVVYTDGGGTVEGPLESAQTAAVANINDAPVLDNSGSMFLTSITENDTSNSGDLISAIISSATGDRITDADSGSVEGIAILGLTSSNGTWQYDTGSGWTDVGTVSASSSLLLRATDSLRFVPDGLNSDTAFVTFAAWDQTSGTAGAKVDTSVFGGTTAFSATVETASISVTSVNDAPVLDDGAGLYTFSTITEAETNNSGDTIATLLASNAGFGISDVDSGAIEGIAVRSAATTYGKFQYSINGGSNWFDVGTISSSSALLLRDTDLLRFQPDDLHGTLSSISFVAWDRSDGGTEGTKVTTLATGGTTAFSDELGIGRVTVTEVNDAPVLDNTPAVTLDSQPEDDGTPGIGEGTLISDLIDESGGAGYDNVSDVDSGSVTGIAITAADTTHGSWWVTTDGGNNWNALGNVTDSNARLLAANASTYVFFEAHDNFNGTITNAITFRAWDQSSGSNGGGADTSTNGTTTAFSTATDTADITISAANDAPAFIGTTLVTNGTFDTDLSNWTATGNVDVSGGELRFGSVGGANGILSQTIATTIGQTYYVRFDYGDRSGTQTQSLRFEADGTASLFVADITTGAAANTLEEYKYAFIADSTSTTLTFTDTSVSHSGVRGYLDNIRMTAPATASSALAYTEGDGAVVIDSSLTITDIDHANINSAVIQITGNYANGEDVLAFVDTVNITGSWTAGTGTLTLTGADTLANYETAIRSITYANSSEAPSTSTRTVSLTVNDSIANSTAMTRAISYSAVNDAPVVTAPVGPLAATEQVWMNFEGSGFSVADPDDAGAAMTATLTATQGAVSVTLGDSGVAIVSGNGSGAVELSGTETQLNALLTGTSTGTLQYRHPSNSPPASTTLTLTVNDEGNTGTDPGLTGDGTSEEDSAGVTINITAVNDAPGLSSFAAVIDTTAEDTEVELTLAELKAQADESDSDGTVDAFVVKSVATGTLKIGANAGAATAWAAGTNDTIDSTNHAYWTPDNNVTGTQNAFAVVAEDNLGAESTGNVTAQVSVSDVNDIPTLTTFAAVADTTNEDTEVEVTFAELAAQGDETDSDGTVNAFVVKSITTGTLKIGTNAGAATAWAAGSNDTIDATNRAYWTPANNANGTQNAFAVVAEDDDGGESASNVTVQVSVSDVNDIPTLTTFAAVVDTTIEDTEVEVTFAELTAQGDEADSDGTVNAFVVKSITTGTLKIGANAGAATAWAAGTNDTIDATNKAYWTPANNANGTQNAFAIVAEDDDGGESASNVTVQVSVSDVNDIPTLTTFAAVVDTTSEDTEVEVTFAELAAQGDETDSDGTVTGFVVKSITTGTLKIGANAGAATAWAAGSNDTIDATNKAYWTPANNANGAQNAFAVVAEDDDGGESASNVTVQIAVSDVNDIPTLTTFAAVVDTTAEDTEVEVTFAELAAQGDEADSDGTVNAFVVKSITTGTLKIGANAGAATAWAAGTNDTIDATNKAYWTPASNANGTQNAFAVVAEDDDGGESASNVTVQVSVSDVNDIPTLTTFAAAVDTTIEDTEVEVTFAELTAQGDEADSDGTVNAFVVKSITTGTLKIGANAGAATAWAAGTNDTIDASNHAYWTPANNANGTQNAFQVVAEDDDGGESASNITVQVSVSDVNDIPTLTTFAAVVDTTIEDTEVEVTFAELTAQGDEADSDGTVNAFVVKSITTGTLKIGTNAGAATAWAAGSNDTIDATNRAYWTPANNTNGTQNAFAIVAEDDDGGESASNVTVQVSVSDVNDIPTLTTFATVVDTTSEDTEVEVTFAELAAQGDEADSDGTVNAFVVKSITTGTLKIGANAGAATAWEADTNDTIDATNKAYWTPANNANGAQNAFAVVAEDDDGGESASNVTVQISVSDVNDIPTLTTFAAVVDTTSEDTEVEVTFAELAAQGDETDSDGTVTGFVVKSITTGTLKIGANAGAATAWAAGSNDTIDATNKAYWTPANNANGTQNAFAVVAEDDDGGESTSNVTVQIAVSAGNDVPVVGTNNLTILEGGTVGLTATELSATDVDNADNGLIFTVSSVTAGQFELTSAPQMAITSFTQAQITAGSVVFVHDGSETVPTYNVTVNDGNLTSPTSSATVTFTNVNDAPVITGLGGDSETVFNDGTVYTIDVNAPSVLHDTDSPSDYDSAILRITGSGFDGLDNLGIDTSGSVSLSAGFSDGSNVSVSGVFVGVLSSTANNTMTITFNSNATDLEVDELLRAATFSSTSTTLGSRSIAFDFNDGDGMANGGVAVSHTETAFVWVAQAGNGLVTTNEDATYTFIATDFDFTGITGTNLQFIEIVSLPVQGVLNFNGSAAVVGDIVTKADIDLGRLQFVPVGNENGASYAAFNFHVNNGNATVTVLAGEPNSYTLDGGSLADTDAILADSSNFGVAGTFNSGISVVAADSNIDASYLAQGDVLFNGYVSDGSWTGSELAALDSWVLGGGILISTSDDALYDDVSNYYGLTIGGYGDTTWLVDDATSPIMNGPFGLVGSNGSPFSAAGAIGYFDSGSLAFGDQVLAVDSFNGEPTMVLRQHGSGWILFTADEGIFRTNMTGSGTISTANDILAANIFAWAADQVPSTETHTIMVDVTAVNDDPTNAGALPGTATADEDVPTAIDLSAINLSDIDSAAGNLTVTLNTTSGGVLHATGAGGVGVTGTGTDTITLTGTQTDLNAFLDTTSNVNFTGTLNTNGTGADSVQINVTDNGNIGTGGGGTIFFGTVNVNISAVNDAPTNTVPGTQTVTEEVQTAVTGISIADVDAGVTLLTTRLQVSNGVLNVTLSGAASISAGINDTADLTISGTIADINATLASVRYTSNTNVTGTAADSLTITTNDGGNTGSGGLLQDSDSIQIDVSNVNDEEVLATNNGLVVLEGDTGITITRLMLETTDVDHTAAQLQYTATAIPAATVGTLRLNGTALVNGNTFTQEDVNLGRLTYDHLDVEVFTDGFVFTVDDGSGTSTSDTFAITIFPNNDNAPVITSDGGAASASLSVAENQTAVTTVTATDSDLPVQTMTYSIIGGADMARFAIDSGTGDLTFGSARDLESAVDANGDNTYEVIVLVSDGQGLTDQQTIQVAITDVDEFDVSSISDADTVADEVAENSSVGTTVGITALATDSDGTDTVTYTLDDNAGGRFAIDSSTGIVTVAGTLNREANATHTITVRASSTDTSTTTRSYTINVLDVDEFDATAISDTDATAEVIDENVSVGTRIGITAFSEDLDATNNLITYSLDDSAGGLFAIDSSTGVVTTASAIDYESHGSSLSITVRADSVDGSTTTQAYSITISDLDEFNVIPIVDNDVAADVINENVAIGAAVGITAFSEDLDGTNNTVSYSIDDSAGGLFAIDGSTGVVTTAAAIDYESVGSSLNIVVRATSTDGSTTTQGYSVAVTDVDEFNVTPIADNDASTDNVNENASIGTSVGITAFSADLDATTNTITYSLDDSAGGRFAIDSSTGILTTASAIDYESDGSSLNIIVRATSADGSSTTQAYTVAVNDLDEFDVSPLVDNNAVANVIDENVPVGTATGITAFSQDLDGTTNTVTYSLDDSAGGLFTIDSSTGIVTTAAAIDFESVGSGLNITVRATSADGSSVNQNYTITVNDLNDNAPVVTLSQSFSVLEHANVGMSVGFVLATDADTVGVYQNWTITSGNSDGIFAIDSNTGEITVADVTNLNHEATPAYNLTISVGDGSNTSTAEVVTVSVIDEDDAPVFTPATAAAIDENASNGSIVSFITATDEDVADILTYSIISGTPAQPFAIDSVSGTITVLDSSLLDFESTTGFSIQVQVSDIVGLTDTQLITINLNDINETPTDISLTGGVVAENSATGVIVGSVTGSDVDAGDSLTYQLTDNSGGRFTIDTVTGQITVSDGTLLNFEANSSHEITVRATDSGSLTYDESFTVTLTDVNEAPQATDDAVVAEQLTELVVAAGVITANDSDIDGDAISVVLVTGPTHGSLTLNADGSFVYMPTGSYAGIDQFTYLVTDGLLDSVSASVVIDIETTISAPVTGGGDDGSDDDFTPEMPITTPEAETSESTETNETSEEQSEETESTESIASAQVNETTAMGEQPLEGLLGGDASHELLRRTSSEAFVAIFLDELPQNELLSDEARSSRSRSDRDSDDGRSVRQFLFAQVTTANPLFSRTSFDTDSGVFAQQNERTPLHDFVMDKVVVGTTAAVSTSVSVGYVVWMLRSGSLLTTLLSSLPAWQAFDPLPILDSFDNSSDDDDDDSLLSIVS